MSRYVQLLLTCANVTEANLVASSLLDKKLISCAKQLPVGSDFLWQDKIDHNDEVLLILESREDLFEEIETEVAKLHSYETFVLQAVPVIKTSKDATKWLNETLKSPKNDNINK